MHIFVGQTFIIVVGILFFVFWVGRSAPAGGKNG
jgi:hypothetical protein